MPSEDIELTFVSVGVSTGADIACSGGGLAATSAGGLLAASGAGVTATSAGGVAATSGVGLAVASVGMSAAFDADANTRRKTPAQFKINGLSCIAALLG